MKTLVDGLSPAGNALLAARLKDSSPRVPGSEPLKEIVSEGDWASQTGSDIWRLAAVSLLLYRPILADTTSQDMQNWNLAWYWAALPHRCSGCP
eukprot:g13964.t1